MNMLPSVVDDDNLIFSPIRESVSQLINIITRAILLFAVVTCIMDNKEIKSQMRGDNE
jgi:hypothetical protein